MVITKFKAEDPAEAGNLKRSWRLRSVGKKPTLAVEKKHCPTERYLPTEHQDAKQKSWTVTT
jgi:hypothetical protein